MRLKNKKMIVIIGILIAIIAVGIGGYFIIYSYNMNMVSKMTFEEMLSYITKNNEKVIITVGIAKNGEAQYTVYGKNGALLEQHEHIYEIGSITKTFAAALLLKAIQEGKINLNDSIDKYLELPVKEYYPTIKQLITHTSGYKVHYEAALLPFIIHKKNLYYGVSKEQLLQRIGKINLKDKDYPFVYSNFGISVIGVVLSEIYGEDFYAIINDYVSKELGLNNTKVSNGSGDLEKYWDWSNDDAYIPAGALVSTIGDMLKYAELQIDGTIEHMSATHEPLAEISATSSNNAKLNVRYDSAGAAWFINSENNIIWHDGGTGHQNSYLGFDPDKQIAVVILSNLPPSYYRIYNPAPILGAKLLTDLQK